MDREHTCCFTGHRPDKLPWGSNESDPRCHAVYTQLSAALDRAYEAGCRHFICGMARGGDLLFCRAALDLRDRRPGVTVEGAVPCQTQADRWPADERERRAALLDRCDFETMVQHHYDWNCMMRRNRYMVDRSCRVIALYDGIPSGGTAGTLAYAMKHDLICDIIRPE